MKRDFVLSGQLQVEPWVFGTTKAVFFLYSTRLYHGGNLCCRFHMLRSRLCSRLEINWYEITAYRPINSPENSVTDPGSSQCADSRNI